MSFYKLDGEAILVAPNFVYSPTFSLLATSKDTYEFPVGGWHWFDSDSEAESFFGVPISTPEILTDVMNGKRPAPVSPEAFIAELPAMVWPEN